MNKEKIEKQVNPVNPVNPFTYHDIPWETFKQELDALNLNFQSRWGLGGFMRFYKSKDNLKAYYANFKKLSVQRVFLCPCGSGWAVNLKDINKSLLEKVDCPKCGGII